ncbi:MAG TPA: AIR synthase-related protein, partial [Gemmatimonadales bacterium]|nr:AIR synthase-related protein [Gemmatimonadales bacterium]
MGDLEDTIAGLARAARALGGLAAERLPGVAGAVPLPFVSGNVSLYNQVGRVAIPPSPIVMCAGVLTDVSRALGQGARAVGHVLVLVGDDRDGLDGSSYRREVLRERGGPPPALDLEREARLQELAVAVAEGGWAVAAHDVSDGGLAVALVEMLLGAPDDRALGAEVDLEPFEVDPAVALFCERPAILYEVPFERLARLSQAAREQGFVAWPVGTIGREPSLRVRVPGGETLAWTVEELAHCAGLGLKKVWNEEGV